MWIGLLFCDNGANNNRILLNSLPAVRTRAGKMVRNCHVAISFIKIIENGGDHLRLIPKTSSGRSAIQASSIKS